MLVGMISCGTAYASSHQRGIPGYVHTAWTERDGAPERIRALAQTPDGFLWIGAASGLHRFNGTPFERTESASGPKLHAKAVRGLLAGTCRFHVCARNVGGKWNAQDTAMVSRVAPSWFQTIWFRSPITIIAILVAWILYRIRLRQLTKAMSIRFDDRLAERTRIARDLHDSLLQTIQGCKLIADSALKQSADTDRMHTAMKQLSGWLGLATEEGRRALNSLRTSTAETNDLADAFRRSIDECSRQTVLQASLSVAGEVSEMHPVVRDEVFRIGYEAIRNACAHSQASRLQINLTYAEDLTLSVRDNGVGMDPNTVNKGKQEHFGIQGMRERAERIRSKLTIATSASSGTEVKLIVPGIVIYRHNESLSLRGHTVRSLLKRIGLKIDPLDS